MFAQEPNFQSLRDRNPPQNVEAEEVLLGSILLDPEAITRVADLLRVDAFYMSAHREIYRTVLMLHGQGKPTDLTTVAAWLKDKNKLEEIGGQSRLAQLVDRTITTANVDQYAELVMEKFLRRQLIKAGNEVVGLGYDTEKKLEEVLDQSEQKIFGITQDRPQAGLTSTSEILTTTFNEIESRAMGTALSGIPCNFYDLDAMTQGFQRSDLVIVAGRPSMGKCLAHDSEIVTAGGAVLTISEIYQQQQATLLTLGKDWQFHATQPSAFVDDGIKPVFRVTTRLGRTIETTLTHPFLTIEGWKPLEELQPGIAIAVPRQIPIFGQEILPDFQVKLLAYLIGDGCLTGVSPQFTNSNPKLQADFAQAVSYFPDLTIHERTSQGTRVLTAHVVRSTQTIIRNRQTFATQLKKLLQNHRLSGRKLAQQLDVSPPLITSWLQAKCAPNPSTFEQICKIFAVEPHVFGVNASTELFTKEKNSLANWLEGLGLWGQNSHEKIVPDVIFKLNQPLISLFLNRLFSTDGWISTLKTNQVQLGYASVNHKLAQQVQHLLLRFGVIASLKQRSLAYKSSQRTAWQLDITDAQSIRTFIEEIGIFGKEEAIERAKVALNAKRYQTNRDLIPVEIWYQIAAAKGAESWQSLGKRAGIQGYSNIHAGRRCLSRARLTQLSQALADRGLYELATSQVYWDQIVSIELTGYKQVYDLTIPDTHNFVANDICVHNTSFVLNIARNIAVIHKLPICIFSLEMSKEQLVYRLLSSEVGIESGRLRTGRVRPEEWEVLGSAMGRLSELPIYIDDTADMTVMEMRSKARRLQSERGGELGMVLIDYLQLMEGSTPNNRVQELSKITRSLKGMARELNAPVMTLSQLSRGVESRTNKRPMMSDLRESGSIEQDADLIVMLYRDEYYNPDTPDRGITEVIITKHRNGPTGTVNLLFEPQYTRFRNLASNT
jgi:replicative DNA helicase